MNILIDANLQNSLKTPEGITGGVVNINSDHSAIHLGYGANISDYGTLASGATKEYCITAPLELYVHFKNISLNSLGGSCKLEIIRGATVTENTGTELTATNPNDNFSGSPESTVKESPSYTGGSIWDSIYVLADETNQFVGSAQTSLSETQELVFKNNNEQYIIKITNLETSEITFSWRAFWYEEPLGKVE